MNLTDYFTKFPNQHLLSPEELLNKQWAWSWTHSAFGGSTIMTILTAILGIWPFFWIGVVLFIMYVIYIPLQRRSKHFSLISNIFCIAVMLWAFTAMIYMGGLLTSFGLVLVGLNCAMSSVLSNDKRWVFALFGIYTLIVIITGALQPLLTTPDWVLPHHNLLYFVINAIWLIISALSTTLMFISDRSRLEKMEAQKLKELQEVRTKFYTNITHEFRTPLTVIQGMADQIKEAPEKWTGKGTDNIKIQSKRLLNLVNQMMDISKLESGKVTTNMIHGDIIAYLGYLVESFQGFAESRRVTLIFESSIPKFFVDYDAEKLLHIISNLISNAIKFSKEDGEIVISFDVHKSRSVNEYIITVKDDGIGIAKEALPFIFDRYYQGNNRFKSSQSGSGLGLALTKGLVELMGGNIYIDSTEGEMTKVTLFLPAASSSEFSSDHGISTIKPAMIEHLVPDSQLSSGVDIKLSPTNGEKPSMLIIEDNPSLQEYMKEILEDHYTIYHAPNGRLGVEYAKKHIPDVILSDVMMPEKDGFEVVENLKNDPLTDHIPIILLTALSDFENRLKGLEMGADYYISKPFEKQELLAILHNLFERRSNLQKKLSVYPLQNESPAPDSHDHDINFLQEIRKIVYENCDNENFDVSQLCHLLGMSRAQLYRKFRALTGGALGKYIKKIRLHKAKDQLEFNHKNVTEAAFESGFKNLSHFSVIFKEEFGVSPKDLKVH